MTYWCFFCSSPILSLTPWRVLFLALFLSCCSFWQLHTSHHRLTLMSYFVDVYVQTKAEQDSGLLQSSCHVNISHSSRCSSDLYIWQNPRKTPTCARWNKGFHQHKILLLWLLQQVLREIRQDLSFICRSKPLSSIGIRKTYLMNIIILVGISDSQSSYLILTKLYFFLLIFPQLYCLFFFILWERPVPVSGMVPFYT